MIFNVRYYSLPVNCLVEPRSSRLLRLAKDSLIEELKLAMQANLSVDAAQIVGLVILDEGIHVYTNVRYISLVHNLHITIRHNAMRSHSAIKTL